MRSGLFGGRLHFNRVAQQQHSPRPDLARTEAYLSQGQRAPRILHEPPSVPWD